MGIWLALSANEKERRSCSVARNVLYERLVVVYQKTNPIIHYYLVVPQRYTLGIRSETLNIGESSRVESSRVSSCGGFISSRTVSVCVVPQDDTVWS